MKRTTEKRNKTIRSKKNRTYKVKSGNPIRRSILSSKTFIRDSLKNVGETTKGILEECAKENIKKGLENACRNIGKTKTVFRPSIVNTIKSGPPASPYITHSIKRSSTLPRDFKIDFSKYENPRTPERTPTSDLKQPSPIKKTHIKSKKPQDYGVGTIIKTAPVTTQLFQSPTRSTNAK
jgi:hypothetical protein